MADTDDDSDEEVMEPSLEIPWLVLLVRPAPGSRNHPLPDDSGDATRHQCVFKRWQCCSRCGDRVF